MNNTVMLFSFFHSPTLTPRPMVVFLPSELTAVNAMR